MTNEAEPSVPISDFDYDRNLDAIEYGVRSHDDLDGTRITPKPSLVMAEDYANYLRRVSSTRGTYKIHVELVHRWPDGEWTPLSSEDAEQIKNEAWEGLDRAMAPIIGSLAGPVATVTRPKASEGGEHRG